jgi:Protein of unknown function (DUF1592)/Protein of unknown function (DUF1588)/Protein of unknown function (DUF1595)/Protein of unknown function (DUF1587)/Protein of unknown function (DUF1585)
MKVLRTLPGVGFCLLAACTGSISGDPQNSATPSASGGTGATAGGASGGPEAVECAAALPLDKPRVWRLTQNQVKNTLRDRLGFVPPAVDSFPAEARLDGFANQASELKISPLLADAYFRAGEELAAQVATSPSTFGVTCAIADMGTGSCLSSFIASFGEKMWRRPLTDAEVTAFSGLYQTTAAQGEGPAGGVKSLTQAFFMSPNFLHRSELGTSLQAGAVTALTDYELASALSYTLWDTAPDNALLDLAKQGKLHDKAVLLGEAKRLLASPAQASSAMNSFVQQWLFLDNLASSTKDQVAFPAATAEVAADMAEESRLFVNSILFDAGGDRSFKTLFTASYGFVNSRTAPLYGLQGITGPTLVKHDLDPSQRRGIFSLAPFMWGHATEGETNLVGRGSYFRAEVLCDQVPLPPGGIPQDGKFAPPDATGREKLTIHADPACAVCHERFDGIGFAMENYDAVGQFRATDHGKQIDPSGSVPLPSEPNGPNLAFANFVDLVDKLANKPDVYACFAKQYLSYASGKGFQNLNACEKQAISDEFAKGNYKVDELVLSVISSQSFQDRKN